MDLGGGESTREGVIWEKGILQGCCAIFMLSRVLGEGETLQRTPSITGIFDNQDHKALVCFRAISCSAQNKL